MVLETSKRGANMKAKVHTGKEELVTLRYCHLEEHSNKIVFYAGVFSFVNLLVVSAFIWVVAYHLSSRNPTDLINQYGSTITRKLDDLNELETQIKSGQEALISKFELAIETVKKSPEVCNARKP